MHSVRSEKRVRRGRQNLTGLEKGEVNQAMAVGSNADLQPACLAGECVGPKFTLRVELHGEQSVRHRNRGKDDVGPDRNDVCRVIMERERKIVEACGWRASIVEAAL